MNFDEFGSVEPDSSSEESAFSFLEALQDIRAREMEHSIEPRLDDIWEKLDLLYQGDMTDALPAAERRVVDAYEELATAFLALEAEEHRRLLASLDEDDASGGGGPP